MIVTLDGARRAVSLRLSSFCWAKLNLLTDSALHTLHRNDMNMNHLSICEGKQRPFLVYWTIPLCLHTCTQPVVVWLVFRCVVSSLLSSSLIRLLRPQSSGASVTSDAAFTTVGICLSPVNSYSPTTKALISAQSLVSCDPSNIVTHYSSRNWLSWCCESIFTAK